MTVFTVTGQWIIAKNIDTIMGLQATATKRKLELDNKSCASDAEERCQEQQQINENELNVDEVDGSVSPPKITKYELLPEAEQITTGSRVENLTEAEQEYEEQTKGSINISHKEEEEQQLSSTAAAAAVEEDINVQELTNECKSTYISHSLAQPMIVEDSIAKLEAVAVPGEIIAPWTASSSVDPQMAMDSISRLQAVAVPDEGADGTRSALATTLLSTDDLCDDDDDDFDDDFDEDDHLPPRYHHCPPPPRSYGGNHSSNGGGSYSSKLQSSPPHSYYMDYPPQLNTTSRGSNGQQYNNRVYNWQQSYGYEQQQQQGQGQPQSQQTIRCAENGKSYLELGSSSNASPPAATTTASSSSYQTMNGHQMHQMHRPAPSVTPHHPHYHHPSSYHHPHHPHHHHPHHHHPSAAMKRCCDGRPSTWCQSNNKQCYKDRRVSMLNLSMFKLSRFRQVSEQSLYRSVLICNTLKQIEREIEIENKEAQAAARQQQQHQMHLHAMHQQQMHHMQQQQQQAQQQQQQQQGSSAEQSYSNSSSSSNSQVSSLYQRQTTTSPVFSQQQQQQHLHHNQLHSAVHHHHHHPQQQLHFQSNTDGVVTYSSQSSVNNTSSSSTSTLEGHLPIPTNTPPQSNGGGITGFTFGASATNSSPARNTSSTVSPAVTAHHQQQQMMPFNDSLPPYDHPHPLRDTSSGRATPFPSTPTANGAQSDTDSGFGDEDCTRPINWGSVLSLSSQSALDPLAGSDLFATGATGSPLTPITPTMITVAATPAGLPPTNIENGTSTSSAHLKVLSSVKDSGGAVTTASSTGGAGSDGEGDSGISMMDDEDEEDESSNSTLLSIGSSSTITTVTNSILRTTSHTSVTPAAAASGNDLLPSWLDMESELTELLPSWKLAPLRSEDILKSVPHHHSHHHQQSMEPTRIPVHEQDMETGFTHIMVVS